MKSFRTWAALIRQAFGLLLANDPLRMAGATAFFTTFALPPILLIIIQSMGLFMNRHYAGQQLLAKLSGIIGPASAAQLRSTLTGFQQMSQNWLITIGGFFFLLFVATTLFKVIKGSMNQIWGIRVQEGSSWRSGLGARLMSVLVILGAGLLFLLGLLAEAAQAYLGDVLPAVTPRLAAFLNSTLSQLISMVMITLWFVLLFRYLPDGRPRWKVALMGGLCTGILFSIGRLLLRWLLTHSNIDTLYGASGSLVLLLLFVFYSALILYFGAAFTRIWADHHEAPIQPLPHANCYKLVSLQVEPGK